MKEGAPDARIWAGEEGPKGGGEDGTCGYATGLSACGTFATVPWYADDMALRASHGFSRFQRQDLLGARYSLIGTSHDDESLSVDDPIKMSPNYWVNFVWKRLVGTTVFRTTNETTTPSSLRTYAFAGVAPSPWAVAGANDTTLLVINLGSSTASLEVSLTSGDAIEHVRVWSLTAGPNGVNSTELAINGVVMRSVVSDGTVDPFMPTEPMLGSSNGSISVPPSSVTFVVLST